MKGMPLYKAIRTQAILVRPFRIRSRLSDHICGGSCAPAARLPEISPDKLRQVTSVCLIMHRDLSLSQSPAALVMGLTCGKNVKVGGSIQHTVWENSPGNHGHVHTGLVVALFRVRRCRTRENFPATVGENSV